MLFNRLPKSDEALLDKIMARLQKKLTANPYAEDGELARQLGKLPPGLRAMGATYHLDVSLVMDSICWHFLNFGEEGLVKETERGLRLLGLEEVAGMFAEAHGIYKLVAAKMKAEELDFHEAREATGYASRDRELSNAARELLGEGGIFTHWITYARDHPEQVFGSVVNWH